ncbi:MULTISPECIES: alanine racemase [unclassified Paenibacillus]|uniref:alanine racemase n=1 Tax=unclassified Paenibacillus TaxID=185978 RepID=UPI000931DA9A|nr:MULTISPECIES: alanine racemase [unclassified Paenibacillus]
MDSFYRSTRVEISLDALRHNLEAFRGALPEAVRMMAVVKADAYGHGAVEVCREALSCGVEYIAVAFLDEGLELRRADIKAPILVLGYTPPEGLLTAWEQDIALNVYTEDILEAWERVAPPGAAQRPLRIHIKMDSGMNRLGIGDTEAAVRFIERARHTPGIEVEGLFTHYACADERDKTHTRGQFDRFAQVVRHFEDRGITFPLIHAGNSAAAIDLPELTFNMVRLGIAMYGLYPSEEVNKTLIGLRPVLSIKTGVVMVKQVPVGEGISYGAVYRTKGEETIATLPIGYADGFSRLLTGKAQVLIRGQRVPVVGRICMDQCMLNVTGLADIPLEEEVVILGTQGGEAITAEEHASWLGTVNYEIVCMISHRVPRVYVKNGSVVRSVNPLLRHLWEQEA